MHWLISFFFCRFYNLELGRLCCENAGSFSWVVLVYFLSFFFFHATMILLILNIRLYFIQLVVRVGLVSESCHSLTEDRLAFAICQFYSFLLC